MEDNNITNKISLILKFVALCDTLLVATKAFFNLLAPEFYI